jgi:hypothetical protein
MLMSSQQNRGQDCNIKIGIKSFENLLRSKYLGMTLINQNCIYEDIGSRLNSGNACYHSVQNSLYFHFMSKSITIKICKMIIVPVLYGSRILSVIKERM